MLSLTVPDLYQSILPAVRRCRTTFSYGVRIRLD